MAKFRKFIGVDALAEALVGDKSGCDDEDCSALAFDKEEIEDEADKCA